MCTSGLFCGINWCLASHWVTVGLGVWLAAVRVRERYFYGKSIFAVIRGFLFATLLWPVALFFIKEGDE